MSEVNIFNDPSLLSIEKARASGLVPHTLADRPNRSLRIGDGRRSIRYIDWLMMERERITRGGDRRAAIVDAGNGRIALWVDEVADW